MSARLTLPLWNRTLDCVRRTARRGIPLLAIGAIAASISHATAQHHHPTPHPMPIVAGAGWRVVPTSQAPRVMLESTAIHVQIDDLVATTTYDITVRNDGTRIAEATVLLPLPFDAVVTGMLLDDPNSSASGEGAAKLLPRDEARRVYEGIVARLMDPALLEFVGWNLVQTRVFPVAPKGTQRVRIVLEHVLDGGAMLAPGGPNGNLGGNGGQADRVDLLIPRSEIDGGAPTTITVDMRSTLPIVDVFSPTHAIEMGAPVVPAAGTHHRRITVASAALKAPGSFRLTVLRDARPANQDAPINPLASSVMLLPDPIAGGGYFMLLAAPWEQERKAPDRRRPREVTFVLDRSGSMAGEKMRQAREAAMWLLDRLTPDDSFNLITFSHRVEMLFDAPRTLDRETLATARQFIERIGATGGTNIHDALLTALSQRASEGVDGAEAGDTGVVRTIVFLTDGLPTVGRTAESEIRALAEKGNRFGRRIHVLGVGNDVNAPLLDRVGSVTDGQVISLREHDSIVDAVARLAVRIDGPAIEAMRLDASRAGTVADVLPMDPGGGLPALYRNDRLVLVGRYLVDAPFELRISGTMPRLGSAMLGGRIAGFEHTVAVDPGDARGTNAFIGRLWASRQIALLIDAIRQAGGHGPVDRDDPRVRELVESIVALSLRWGILTEYTAFLATDGAPLGDAGRIVATCTDELMQRAVATRSGIGGVSQSINHWSRANQARLNPTNRYMNEHGVEVEVRGVCQIAQESAFRRGDRWYDGRAAQGPAVNAGAGAPQYTDAPPARTVEWGTAECDVIVDRLVAEGRQALLALGNEVVVQVGSERVLVRHR